MITGTTGPHQQLQCRRQQQQQQQTPQPGLRLQINGAGSCGDRLQLQQPVASTPGSYCGSGGTGSGSSITPTSAPRFALLGGDFHRHQPHQLLQQQQRNRSAGNGVCNGHSAIASAAATQFIDAAATAIDLAVFFRRNDCGDATASANDLDDLEAVSAAMGHLDDGNDNCSTPTAAKRLLLSSAMSSTTSSITAGWSTS